MEGTESREHWEGVWADRDPHAVSWFEASPETSLAIIDGLGLPSEAPIIDVGGGASVLASELLARGYSDLTVADISDSALALAREQLGSDASEVDWVVADVREATFGRQFALWHDRAVFHFLIDARDRQQYLDAVRRNLLKEGCLIVATFGPNGPTTCSGLPVARYGPDELAAVFSPVAELVSADVETHLTPSNKEQQFLYAVLRRLPRV